MTSQFHVAQIKQTRLIIN